MDKRFQLNNWISWVKGLKDTNPSLLSSVELKIAIIQDGGHLSSRDIKMVFSRMDKLNKASLAKHKREGKCVG